MISEKINVSFYHFFISSLRRLLPAVLLYLIFGCSGTEAFRKSIVHETVSPENSLFQEFFRENCTAVIEMYSKIPDNKKNISVRKAAAECFLETGRKKEYLAEWKKIASSDVREKANYARTLWENGNMEEASALLNSRPSGIQEIILTSEMNIRKGELNTAEKELKEAAEKYPAYRSVCFSMLSEIYLIQGDRKKYRDFLKKSRNRKPENTGPEKESYASAEKFGMAGDRFFQKEKYIEAGKAYSSALELEPDDLSVLEKLAWTELALKNYRKSESLFNEILEKEPLDGSAVSGLAFSLCLSGSFFKLIEIQKRFSDLTDAFDAFSIFEEMKGNMEKSRMYSRTDLERKKDSMFSERIKKKLIQSLKKQLTFFESVRQLEEKKEFSSAEKMLESSESSSSEISEFRKERIKFLHSVHLFESGQYEEADEKLKSADSKYTRMISEFRKTERIISSYKILKKYFANIKKADQFYSEKKWKAAYQEYEPVYRKSGISAVLVRSADCLFQAGEREKAILLLKKELTDKKDDTEILEALGIFHSELGQNDAAVKYLQSALNEDTSDRADYHLGIIYLKTDPELSLKHFSRAFALKQSSVYKAAESAALFRLGRQSEAVEVLLSARKMKDWSSLSETAQAVLLFKSGEYSEAERMFGKILKTDPSSSDSHYYLSFITESKNSEAAVSYAEKAYAAAPEKFAYRERLIQLYSGLSVLNADRKKNLSLLLKSRSPEGERWKELSAASVHGEPSGAVYNDDRLYFHYDFSVLSWNSDSDTLGWRKETKEKIKEIITGRHLLLRMEKSFVLLNSGDGERLWILTPNASAIERAEYGRFIYFSASVANGERYLYRVDPESGIIMNSRRLNSSEDWRVWNDGRIFIMENSDKPGYYFLKHYLNPASRKKYLPFKADSVFISSSGALLESVKSKAVFIYDENSFTEISLRPSSQTAAVSGRNIFFLEGRKLQSYDAASGRTEVLYTMDQNEKLVSFTSDSFIFMKNREIFIMNFRTDAKEKFYLPASRNKTPLIYLHF
ncbi:MAG TPA: tetratricopeptide repeat protein [Leptospiraceae bacterium]|nr:tetratricopeptide repeat protein [Leptospiraceae bacterium]HNF25425.1 tetratricopeptide repeat protein [Leptospiraceae bacterium]